MVFIVLSVSREREKRLLNLHLDELLSLLVEVALHRLLKVVTNLWLEGLELFN